MDEFQVWVGTATSLVLLAKSSDGIWKSVKRMYYKRRPLNAAGALHGGLQGRITASASLS